MLDEEVAGKDATKAFFSLHRHEVLQKPSYARLQIGRVKDAKESILPPKPGELSKVPYGEPTWLTPGYYSPYFNEARVSYPWRVGILLMISLLYRAIELSRLLCASLRTRFFIPMRKHVKRTGSAYPRAS